MRWRRAGWQLALVLPIGLGFATASLLGTIAAVESARPARVGRHRQFAIMDPPPGPVIVEGHARRSAPLASPRGSGDVAAWIGRVGRQEKTGKTSHFRVYCTLAAIDGIAIEPSELAAPLRLEGWSEHGGHFSMRSTPLDDGFSTINLRHEGGSTAPPAGVKEACPPFPPGSVYDEAVLRNGDAFEVSGCHEGDRLVPCRDGADVVTIGSMRDRFDESLSAAGVIELFASLFGGMGLLAVALFAARARPMLDRSKEPLR